MKIYASRDKNLDRFVGKNVWVKAYLRNLPSSTGNDYSGSFWIRLLPYNNDKFYKINKIQCQWGKVPVHVSPATYKNIQKEYYCWLILPKENASLVTPEELYTTEELFKVED